MPAVAFVIALLAGAPTAAGAAPIKGLGGPASWPVRLVAAASFSFFPVEPVGGDLAVGLVQVHDWAYSPQQLADVDLGTGRLSKGADVPAGSALISYGQDVYVMGPDRLGADGGAVGGYVLRAVSTTTLSVGPAVPVLASCPKCYQFLDAFQPQGPHRGDLWVAAGQGIRLVRPSTGQVVSKVAPGAAEYAAGLVVEPDGRYLDISTDAGVTEVSTSTGTVVKRLATPFAIHAPQLVAVPGGLWLSWRTGNAGSANFFAEGSLKASPNGDRPSTLTGPPLPGDGTMMGDWVTRVGDLVILTNPVGATCVRATGGKVLASSTYGHNGQLVEFWTPFGGTGSTLYAVASNEWGMAPSSVVGVALPKACGHI